MPTVLVVDDNADVRETLGDLLEIEGFSVRRARNGDEALRELRGGRALPDALLLDVLMPGMTGPELLAALRGTAAAAVPAVVMTGYDEGVFGAKLGVPVFSKTDFAGILSALRASCRGGAHPAVSA